MAALSANLPTEVDSQQRFVASAPATPSPLTGIADFATGMVGVVDAGIKTIGRDRAGKSAAGELAAHNDAAKATFNQIFSEADAAPQGVSNTVTSDPGHNAAVAQAKGAAGQVVNQQTAANQGTIDPAMAQARGLAVLKQVMAAHPGHEAAVVSTFKELGVTNMITQQYANAETSLESDATAQQATMHKLQDLAVTKYGFTDFYKQTPQQQAVTLATVGATEAKEADLDAQTKAAALATSKASLTADETKAVQAQSSSSLFDSANTYMSASFSNLMKMTVNMLGDTTLAAQPGRLEQLTSHMMTVALPALDLAYSNKKAQMGSLLSPEDSKRLDDNFHQQRQALVDILSGPQSVVEMNKRVLENISNTMGIDYAKSAPTLMKLQKLIGPQAIGVLMSPAVTGNPALNTMLKNELNGVLADPSKMPSFTEFVQSLNGQIDPTVWDPEKQRAMAPASLASTAALAKDPPIFNGTDKEGHKALVNSIKNTAGVAVDVVSQWGFGNVLAQSKVLNYRGVTTAMFNTSANKPEQMDAIRSWIPANTRSYETLSGLSAGDRYYDVKLDPHTLTWSAVRNSTPATMAMPGVGMEMALRTAPAPSTKVLEQASTLNHMLNNLSDAASKGFDDSLGGKNIPYQEARRYFATGAMPATLNKTPEQNVDDAISHMLDFVNKAPTPGEAPKVHPIGPSPLAPVIAAAADKHGVPTAIAAALFNTETSGGRNTKTSDKGAKGPGQIMPATAAAYGRDVNSLSDADNIDLSLQILADNHKQGGSWEDALARYHSGHDLATATARGLTDGHMKTADYVATTMAAASSISPENLARYGYVRR